MLWVFQYTINFEKLLMLPLRMSAIGDNIIFLAKIFFCRHALKCDPKWRPGQARTEKLYIVSFSIEIWLLPSLDARFYCRNFIRASQNSKLWNDNLISRSTADIFWRVVTYLYPPNPQILIPRISFRRTGQHDFCYCLYMIHIYSFLSYLKNAKLFVPSPWAYL